MKLSKFADYYLEHHALPHKKTWKQDYRRLHSAILPKLGGKNLARITFQDVQKLHTELSLRAPYEANRVLALLRTMFTLALRCGYIASNSASGIRLNRERKRERWLSREELERLADVLRTERNAVHAKAIWLYLLTGMRKSELLKLSWNDVYDNHLELRDTKNGSTHRLPLSAPAKQILDSLPRRSMKVFPSLNIRRVWQRVRVRAGIADVRLHDLRRTVGSWLVQDGASLHLVGKVLNHKCGQTTQVYAHFHQDNVDAALTRHANNLRGYIWTN